jgi:predicted DCC family thiol-disulfide oxidoreductase YuxK
MSLQSWTTLKISDSVNSNTNALKLNANIQQSITQLPDSVIVIKNNQVYIESDAVLEVLKQLSGPMKMLLIGYCIPKGIRNRLYRWVAKNRYRWFGKTDTCSL